jgi:Domain of unknown function (DUF2828).
MNKFVEAVVEDARWGKTYNGADTLNTTSSRVLDLFKAIGQRGADLTKEFDRAVAEDKALAFRTLLYTRDIREGAGERAIFRTILRHCEKHYLNELLVMLPHVPKFGRWDDLLILESDIAKVTVHLQIKEALDRKDGLCAKWLPRKGKRAAEIRKAFNWSPKRYRKTIVNLTKVVETQMCQREWTGIKYDHVPSLAAARYQKAFFKHDPVGYKSYRDGLTKINPVTGKIERKINAGAVYPYDVIKSLRHGDRQVAEAQWAALPNFMGDATVLPLVDCSGSMDSWSYYGQRPNISSDIKPIDIAVSLGIYTADKQKGAFKDIILQFASEPKIQKLEGNLTTKYQQVCGSRWAGSTNIIGAYEEILRFATKNRVPQEDMPQVLMIISDMEFDQTCRAGGSAYGGYQAKKSNFDELAERFANAGYRLPQIVFWNVNGRADNNQVSAHQNGAALVSGFSPSILKTVLSYNPENYTPYNVMLRTLLVQRYDVPGLTI